MITELEQRVMAAIPKECFYESGFDSTLWTDCFVDTVGKAEGIDPKQSRALLVTLAKKKYISVSGGKEGTITLLEKGKTWLLEQNLVDKEGTPIKK